MGARTKLNSARLIGAAVVAGFVGLVFQSWLIFIIAFVGLVAVGLHDRTIRLQPQPRKR